ncbi:MAG: phage portal protein [Oscillospiraceae bacterium]|nr:phage portal protein [Oscillospiraceae bacterium]
MNYSAMQTAIVKVLNDSGDCICANTEMAAQIQLWSVMYENSAPWLDCHTYSANLPAAIAYETSKLVTLEMKSEITGNGGAEKLNKYYQSGVVKKLRQYVEYGLAKGSLVIKPIAYNGGIRTQFIQAGRFFPISFDGSGRLTKCVFTEQIRKGRYIYTLLEIHSISAKQLLTIENRAFKSALDSALGSEVELFEVEQWADLSKSASFTGIDILPFGLFICPMANQVDCDSPLGVSVYSRATELIREADKRYSDICWEYEATQAAVHIGESMLKFDKEQGKHIYPEGKQRLYRAFDYASGANDKPLLEVFSPEIRSTPLFDGWNNQLRLIEFACSLAYGTLSDPQNVDKTAEEIKSSKQRSYTFISDVQSALQTALEDWAKAASFWSAIYGIDSAYDYEMSFEWGDSILANPDIERENDRKDLANGTLRPEEYRAKWRGETIDEALKNLPQTAQVLE